MQVFTTHATLYGHSTLYWIVLCYSILHHTRHYITLYCTVLYCTILCYSILYKMVNGFNNLTLRKCCVEEEVRQTPGTNGIKNSRAT